MTIAEQKSALREEMLARRPHLKPAAPGSALAMAQHFLLQIPIPAHAVVSGYSAIGDEADPAPLLEALRARGHAIALPRVVKRGEALAFHLHRAGVKLVPAKFGLMEPGADWPAAVPTVLVVPLLAFDANGFRLGYGAGFYDMTISALRSQQTILAVGLAFAGQEVPEVPHHGGDAKLDWIVTELYARRFRV